MNLRTISSYNLRQLALPLEYQIRFANVKEIITRIIGKRPSSELTLMALIDEFLNLHGEIIDEGVAIADRSAVGDLSI